MVEVRLARVRKSFNSVLAVDDVSFTVAEGEFLALVGPSGCGKTTILRLIAGFERPDAGDILFSGRSVLALPAERRRVGMVFQNYALFPHMTVAGNVGYGLRFRPGSDRRARVAELLRLVDLAGLEDRSPAELSAGQRQRAALARTLAPEPQLLLLDEPLSALDAKLRERLRLEIRRLQRQLRITTIYVTHDQEEALAISDRVAVMNSGRIEQLGTPQEVYARPATAFVASFIGRGNLLSGEISEIESGKLVVRLLPQGPAVAVAAEATADCLPGEQVKFLIRPERIKLGAGLANRLRGRLKGVEFLGDAIWAYLDCAGNELRVKLAPGDLAVAEGEEVEVSFSPSDCYLLRHAARSP
ncbi:MAG: ABC transporter ATP-binding protein [Candidatus Acetothermia bacterium]|jgi:thiamine transport system ATP-binding protein|nr:ABC transporter ATP-binding protein [Candidatus Acetothermia bacterium]MDH7505142.1 ABC transporter ATP-binding protein [Candidatus Acetothermia bacterium]